MIRREVWRGVRGSCRSVCPHCVEKIAIVGHSKIMHRHDIGVIQLSHDLRFFQEPQGPGLILHLYELDGHASFQVPIKGQVDIAHATLAHAPPNGFTTMLAM